MYDYVDGVSDLCDPADWIVRQALEEELSAMAEDEAYQEQWGWVELYSGWEQDEQD